VGRTYQQVRLRGRRNPVWVPTKLSTRGSVPVRYFFAFWILHSLLNNKSFKGLTVDVPTRLVRVPDKVRIANRAALGSQNDTKAREKSVAVYSATAGGYGYELILRRVRDRLYTRSTKLRVDAHPESRAIPVEYCHSIPSSSRQQ
jgi:hypothetical protein